MLRTYVSAAALLFFIASFASGQKGDSDVTKLKTAGKAGHIEIQIQIAVSNGVALTDFKLDGKEIICIAVYDAGPKGNIRVDYFDTDGVRIGGTRVDSEALLRGEKSRLRFRIDKPDAVKVIKIVRDI